MPAITTSITATTSAYQAASTGQGRVLLRVFGGPQARVHIGSSLPSADTANWMALPANEFRLYEELGAGDNVYVRSDTGQTIVQVTSWVENATDEPGGVRPTNIGMEVINKTGSSIGVDKLVAISGLDATSGLPKIVLADADVAAHEDVWVTLDAIDNDDEGVVYRGGTSVANLNTDAASAAGDPVYLSATAGAFTVTAPTSATGIARVHPVGFVLVKHAATGQILWNIGPVRKIGSNELQGGTNLTGLAAAQGGDVAMTGGTSSTAGNAGGAVTLTGGTPGATGVGGAATIAAGAGGATSGNGGVASLTGGAGTNGNAVGGVSKIVAGAGQGTGNGGAAQVTGGASGAGATGTGGAAIITAGAASSTNGEGGVASMTAGAGSGTEAGGIAKVVGGAGGATGAGGKGQLIGGVGGATSGAGGIASVTGGAATNGNSAGGIGRVVGGAGQGTGDGGKAQLTGGASGAGATGNGAAAEIAGGAAASTNGNGGSVVLTPGAKTGTGLVGNIIERGVKLVNQGAPTAKTTSATLTAAEVLAGIITVNQGAAGASAQQLPEAASMDTALPDSAAGDAFDFSVINISVVDAEDASVTTNTGWTLVGSMDIHAYSAAGSLNSSARFRARKTGAGAWVLYRIA